MPTQPRSRALPLAALTLLAAAAISPRALSQSAADWPQFRGPGGMGASATAKLPLTWSPTENVAWKVALPGPGTSSPIVVGDRIFLTYYTGYGPAGREAANQDSLRLHVLCLDRGGGKTLWDKEVRPELPEQDRIREEHGYASSTPAADSTHLFVFFGRSGVLAFTHDGRELWRTSVGSELNGWGSAASPVLYKNLVLINASVESTSLIALDKKTGKEAWRAGGIKEAWNTPLVVPQPDGKAELIVPIVQQVLAFDPDNGKPLWQTDTGIAWYMCPSSVAHEGVVYSIGGRTGGGMAIRTGGRGNVTASHELWRLNKGSNVPSPVYHNGHLYFAHENLGIAYCVEAKSGKLVYDERLSPPPGMIYASPVLADGKIYYISREGRAYVVAAKPAFELLAQNNFERRDMFNASPAITGNRMLVRSDKYLYCLGQ